MEFQYIYYDFIRFLEYVRYCDFKNNSVLL